MDHRLEQSLNIVLENWYYMQGSDVEQAEQAADRFEASFYSFIEQLRDWYTEKEKKPDSLEKALDLPEIQTITKQLPGPLHVVFETELELMVEGTVRTEDDVEY